MNCASHLWIPKRWSLVPVITADFAEQSYSRGLSFILENNIYDES